MWPNSRKGRRGLVLAVAALLALGGTCAGGGPQAGAQANGDALNEAGKITVNGRLTPYLIRRLPVSAFPQLPAAVESELNRRGCLIPQTYEAHEPENVIEASLERSGSRDWAVLCSEKGTVSLLVFFGDSATTARVLATAQETERLEAHGAAGALGFAWGIDAATPEQVHEAQGGMRNAPPRLDHNALAESVIDGTTVYHYYAAGTWTVVGTGD
jgi:hypothetical protein